MACLGGEQAWEEKAWDAGGWRNLTGGRKSGGEPAVLEQVQVPDFKANLPSLAWMLLKAHSQAPRATSIRRCWGHGKDALGWS